MYLKDHAAARKVWGLLRIPAHVKTSRKVTLFTIYIMLTIMLTGP